VNVFITNANVAHIAMSISRSVVAHTKLGKMHTPGGIAEGAQTARGTVPDADLILACVRRWACVVNDRELGQLCDLLDAMLDGREKP